MSWAAIGATVLGAAATAGIAAANQPNYPNPAASSRRQVLAQLRALPGQRMVDVAARMGVPVDYLTGKSKPTYAKKTLSQALADGDITQETFNRYLAAGSGKGTDHTYSPDSIIKVRTGAIPETAHADFTGYGDADVQGALARQQAQTQLDLSRKYAPQFIESAREQQALADPEGTAARAMLASEINRLETERQGAAHPVADTLDQQILSELQAGKSLSPDVQKTVADVVARRQTEGAGGTEGAGDIATQMETGPEGQARLQQRLQKGLSYLSSGATPEDVDYRRRQTSLANMANFLAGRTPTAQFQQLAGGQQGAAPAMRGPNLVGLNPNGQQLANQAAVTSVNLGAQNNANNVNPWFAGLSTLTRGLNVAGSAGWQPFRTQTGLV